jgi:hypothetical protein
MNVLLLRLPSIDLRCSVHTVPLYRQGAVLNMSVVEDSNDPIGLASRSVCRSLDVDL